MKPTRRLVRSTLPAESAAGEGASPRCDGFLDLARDAAASPSAATAAARRSACFDRFILAYAHSVMATSCAFISDVFAAARASSKKSAPALGFNASVAANRATPADASAGE